MRWLALVVVMALGWSLACGAARADSGGGFLGVQLMALTPEVAAESGIPVGGAVLVDSTLPDSPASKAGLAAGQVITVVDGERVFAPDDVVRVISRHRPGDVINLLIKDPAYSYMVATIRATLGTRPAALDGAAAPAPGAATGEGGSFLGVQLVALTPEAAAESGMPVGGAVLVDSTVPDSPAAKAGLAAGQVITVVDGERVFAPDDVVRVVSRHRPGDTISLLIKDPAYSYMTATIRATLGARPAALDAPATAPATGEGTGTAPAPAPQN